MNRALGDDLEHLADDLLPLRLPLALEPEVGVEVRLDVLNALEEVAAADDVPVLGIARLPARAQDVLADEARLGSKRSGELVALRLGADHRLELFPAGPVELAVDDEDGLGVLQRSFGFLERLGARRLAHFKRAAVLTQPKVVF